MSTSGGAAVSGDISGHVHTAPHYEQYFYYLPRQRGRVDEQGRPGWHPDRILEAFEASVWAPAATFIFSVGLVLPSVLQNRSWDLERIFSEIALDDLFTLGFLVLICAILLQAGRYSIIAFMEGYWQGVGPLAKICLRRQQRLRSKVCRSEEHWRLNAFEVAQKGMLKEGFPAPSVQFLRHLVLDETAPGRCSPDEKALAFKLQLDWARWSDPYMLMKLEGLMRRANDFPPRHRVLPTRLGNVLRVAEGSILPRAWGGVEVTTPAALGQKHDHFRARLDMYCLLTATLSLAGLVDAAAFSYVNQYAEAFLSLTVLWVAALFMHRAALSCARDYSGLLRAVSRSPAP
jgi:hypothetical protein